MLDIHEKGKQAHYKLTSTVMLWLQTNKAASGTMSLGGSMTRQAEADMPVANFSAHISNMGHMVEDMEIKLRSSLNDIYFGKTKDIVNDLRVRSATRGRSGARTGPRTHEHTAERLRPGRGAEQAEDVRGCRQPSSEPQSAHQLTRLPDAALGAPGTAAWPRSSAAACIAAGTDLREAWRIDVAVVAVTVLAGRQCSAQRPAEWPCEEAPLVRRILMPPSRRLCPRPRRDRPYRCPRARRMLWETSRRMARRAPWQPGQSRHHHHHHYHQQQQQQ